MAWLFIAAAVIAALFILPGGTRSDADRRLAQIIAFSAGAAALLLLGLTPFGLVIFVIGGTLFGIGWLKGKILGDDLDPLGTSGPKPSAPPPPARAPMDRAEALSVLGLTGALSGPVSDEDIRAAHRRMIARAHPDSGGSDYLAAKVNQARDVLLKG